MAHEALCAAFDPPVAKVLKKGQEWSKNSREAWLTEHPESTRDPNGPVNDLPSQLVKNKDLPDLEAEYQNYLIGEGRILEETSATSIQFSRSSSNAGSRPISGATISSEKVTRNSWSLRSWLASSQAGDSSASSQKAQKWREMAAVYESLRLPDTLEAVMGDDS